MRIPDAAYQPAQHSQTSRREGTEESARQDPRDGREDHHGGTGWLFRQTGHRQGGAGGKFQAKKQRREWRRKDERHQNQGGSSVPFGVIFPPIKKSNPKQTCQT